MSFMENYQVFIGHPTVWPKHSCILEVNRKIFATRGKYGLFLMFANSYFHGLDLAKAGIKVMEKEGEIPLENEILFSLQNKETAAFYKPKQFHHQIYYGTHLGIAVRIPKTKLFPLNQMLQVHVIFPNGNQAWLRNISVTYDNHLYQGLDFPMFSCEEKASLQYVTIRTKEDFRRSLTPNAKRPQEDPESEDTVTQPTKKKMRREDTLTYEEYPYIPVDKLENLLNCHGALNQGRPADQQVSLEQMILLIYAFAGQKYPNQDYLPPNIIDEWWASLTK